MLGSRFFITSIFLFIFHFISCAVAQPYFHDLPDDGTRELAFATDTWIEHQLKSLDYTIHVSTPGFIRKSVTNHRVFNSKEAKHAVFPVITYKWIEGPPFETGDDLHFCINGSNKGFFTIQFEGGLIGYTRDGRFRIDSSNRLVTLSGNYPVLGEAGFIIVPKRGHYTISRRGHFFVDEVMVDQLKITIFESFTDMDQSLHNVSATIFTLTDDIPVVENPEYNILQGFISHSNTFKAYDGWFYRTAHKSTSQSLKMLIENRRALFNAMP